MNAFELTEERIYLFSKLTKDYVQIYATRIRQAATATQRVKLSLKGKENLRTQWWAPLPSLVGGVDLIDSYVNKDETSVTVEFHCHIIQPACTLRIVDRFIIKGEGEITKQENFFDPRDITNPGWR